jgi:hypothetical protein
MVQRARILALTALSLAAWGCATFGGGGVPDVAGHYQGAVVVEGQTIEGELEVVQVGPALTVIFQAPSFNLRATGDGQLQDDGSARIQVDYDLQCPGVAEMSGDFVEDARVFRGSLVATDCSGELAGTFEFSR